MIILGFLYGFGDLIQCLILWCGYSQVNFCNVYIYMLACLILSFQIIIPAGFAIQTGAPLSSAFMSLIKGVNSTFTLVYMIFCLIFYVVAIILSFRAYREFKYAHQRKAGQDGSNGDGGIMQG